MIVIKSLRIQVLGFSSRHVDQTQQDGAEQPDGSGDGDCR